jgi:hypothetical protein
MCLQISMACSSRFVPGRPEALKCLAEGLRPQVLMDLEGWILFYIDGEMTLSRRQLPVCAFFSFLDGARGARQTIPVSGHIYICGPRSLWWKRYECMSRGSETV